MNEIPLQTTRQVTAALLQAGWRRGEDALASVARLPIQTPHGPRDAHAYLAGNGLTQLLVGDFWWGERNVLGGIQCLLSANMCPADMNASVVAFARDCQAALREVLVAGDPIERVEA